MIFWRRSTPVPKAMRELRDEMWRLVVELDLGGTGRSQLGVVAATAGAGTSTVAQALALANAELLQQRTVLVLVGRDSRHRHGRLAREVARLPGLTDWTPDRELPLVTSSVLPGIEILPPGRSRTTRPAAMLADGRIAALAERLAPTGRGLVVWDLPPVKGYPDTKALLKVLHGTILVAEGDRTLQADLAFAAAEIRGANVPIVAGVLNRSGRYSLGVRG